MKEIILQSLEYHLFTKAPWEVRSPMQRLQEFPQRQTTIYIYIYSLKSPPH